MAMRTASPWWASLAFGAGLVFVFLGERLFSYSPGIRGVLTVIGLVLLVAVTLLRAWTMVASTGERRSVERTLLLCQVGALVALLLYAFTTSWGVGHFHWSDKGIARFQTAMTVAWTIVMLCSLIPMFMIELSLGTALRTSIDVGGTEVESLEYMRVRDVGWSGLTIALAGCLMMVTCNVATERNVQKDVSYFKTSSPGQSTKAIVNTTGEPIKALLFFPDPNEVKDQVEGYFQALGEATGKVTIEEHDRLVDADLAAKYHVAQDGVIVLVRGTGDKEKSESITVDTDIERARKGASKLRNFDKEVNRALIKLVRAKRKAYLVTGHGEINDYASVPPDMKGKVPERRTTLLKRELADIGYEVKNLGLIDLAKDVPDDATVVILLGPSVPLQPTEWEAIGRYLDKGGRLLVALDPKGEISMGPLEQKLGVKMMPGDLTDDHAYLPQHGSAADHRWVITTQVSAHASTTSLSRMAESGMLFIDAGALEDVPTSGPEPKKTVTIHSMDSSWLDLNNNFAFDGSDGEKRQRWALGEALEGPKLKDKDGKEKDGYRVLVYADADLFEDVFVQNMGRAAMIMVSGPLLRDSVRWLGGEEAIVGDIVSEDDKAIEHTKAQDAKWFTLTIVGAPLLILGLGLGGTLTRRRRGKKTEVKS